MDMTLEGERNKKMANYIYNWTGKKGRNDLESLRGEEKVWSRGKTGHICQNGVSVYQ